MTPFLSPGLSLGSSIPKKLIIIKWEETERFPKKLSLPKNSVQSKSVNGNPLSGNKVVSDLWVLFFYSPKAEV